MRADVHTRVYRLGTKLWKQYTPRHLLPQEDVVRETLAWFDEYLSGRQ